MNWNDTSRELARALSRYNGLTNSADINLLTEVVTSDNFSAPFRYAHEVIREFEEKGIAPRRAEVHLQHAIAFGFLHRATGGATRAHPQLAKRREATAHIILSPLGRAMRAAANLESEQKNRFRLFLWEYALMERDFDMYGLLLKAAEENDGDFVDEKQFEEKFYYLRQQQIDWMREKFNAPVREEIQRRLPWIGHRVGEGQTGRRRVFERDALFRFSGETPRHHYRQRKKWARDMGHVDSDGRLTKTGKRLAEMLPSVEVKPFFWLAPREEHSRSRFIGLADIPKRQCAPAANLLCHAQTPSEAQANELAKQTAEYMEKCFDSLRLGGFKQASLDAVVPYVYFLERELGVKIDDEKEVFRAVLRDYRDKFVCTLRVNLSQSHYWLRKG